MRFAYPLEPLRADGVMVRPWTDDDLPCVEAAATDPAIPQGTTVPAVFTPEEGRAFLARQHGRLDHREGVSQAIVDAGGGEAVGLIIVQARPHPWVAGLGYWIVPEARGRGLASAAIALVTTWALAELDIERVEAWVAPNNVASQRVLASAGFAYEGRLRSFLRLAGVGSDALVYSRVRSDGTSAPR